MRQLHEDETQLRPWAKMTKTQSDDTTEAAYQRGYQQGIEDARRHTVDMIPRIEVWDFATVKLAEWLAKRKINERNERPPQP